MNGSLIIAVVGKGGTGKTVVATMLIGMLAERFPGEVLAIDADSASSLPYTLSLTVNKTVSNLRKGISGSRDVQDELRNLTSKEIMRSILTPARGFDLMAMGRPEGSGCFCAVNDLLKLGITLLSKDYRVTIIDGEAGPEQLNRRVVDSVDILLVMSDMSRRSIGTAAEIMKVAQSDIGGEISIKHTGLILNRVRGDEPERKMVQKTGLTVLAELPEDSLVNQFDRDGRSLLDLPHNSPSRQAIEALLEELVPSYISDNSRANDNC
jgi:CO dehydrogenase maturation factor